MVESDVKFAENKITDEMLKEIRSFIGTKLRTSHSINNEEATRMAILKYAHGIGDTNPLWTDPDYASKSPYGMLIAPPSWIFSVFSGVQYGFRGMGGFHSGSNIQFYQPIYRNDIITPEMICTDIVGPQKSIFADQTLIEKNDTIYRNQWNEIVAKNSWEVTHFERSRARKKGKYNHVELPHPWAIEELKEIEKEIMNEKRSGPNTPFWEDVNIGTKLPDLIKGPITMSDEIAFLIGGGAPIPRLAAHVAALKIYKRHPAWAFRDPTSCGLEPIYAVHYNKQAARAQGLPYPYDVGYQRHAWQIHFLTNYAGDQGWVKISNCEFRKFVFFSDVIRLQGTVIEKFVDSDGEYCIKVETNAVNQRGENVMPGYGVISLPARENGLSPIKKRLRNLAGK